MNVRKVKLGFILSFAVALFGCLSVSVSDERGAFSGASLQSQDPRCFGCDDVSDLMQCHECWGYHKRSDAHKEPPLVAAECPTCMSIHKFTESHVEPRPAVCGMACPICKGPVGPLAETPHHCPHCPKRKVEIKKLDTTELGRGSMSRVTERSHYVIDNQEAWIALWNRHKGLNSDENMICGNDDRMLPNVDFTKEVVVAVFMGQCKTGGHKASIHGVWEHGVYISVDVSFLYPNELLYETEALTYPFCIVKFAPSDLKKYVKVYIHETWEK